MFAFFHRSTLLSCKSHTNLYGERGQDMSKDQKKEETKKAGFREFLALKTALPADLLAGEMRIEVRGRNILFLQGCRRILSYAPEEIKLAAEQCDICIGGERLICSSFYGGTVTVEGRICSVEYREKGEREA